LRARGGFEVSLRWRHGQLAEVTVVADRNGRCRLQVRDRTVDLEVCAGALCRLNGELEAA
jgi:hypothetical protein